MSEHELKQLRCVRAQIKRSLTRLITFVESQICPEDVSGLEFRLEKDKQLLSQFEEVQSKLELLDEKELEEDTRTPFENKFYDIIGKANNIIKTSQSSNGSTVQVVSIPSQSSNFNPVRLPKVEIPPFSGSYECWLPFSDLFTSMIHNDDSLSDIHKFYYLSSSLRGEAKKLIEALQVTAGNYQVAWDLLKSRYDNKRLTIQHHVKSLFDIPVIKTESHGAIRQLTNDLLSNLRALEALGQPVKSWDLLLIHLIATKLDSTSKCEWEKGIHGTEPPTFKQFENFLSRRCQVLEALNSNKQTSAQITKTTNIRYSATHLVSNISCPICSQNHFIYQCDKFLKQTVAERFSSVNLKKLCINCLKPYHLAKQCKSSKCRKCGNLHNTLLHRNARNSIQPTDSVASTSASTQVVSHHANVSSQVLLSTASIIVFDKNENPHICRALLDSGSQSSFISEKLASRLDLKRNKMNITVTGINSSSSTIKQTSILQIKSRFNNFQTTLECLITPNLTVNIPIASFNKAEINVPNSIKLADPNFNISGEVDLLIGAEIFYQLLCVGQIKPSNNNQPYLQKTQLGWIISGKLSNNIQNHRILCNFATKQLEDNLRRFWELEEPSKNRYFTPEETDCERIFKTTTQRTPEGRFVVSLPIKSNAPMLGESFQAASKRLRNLECKFAKNKDLHMAYNEFMQEYLQLDHMKQIDIESETTPNFYLPHHAVINETSATTKLRVVFDASAKTSNKVSLNDIFLTGPVLQQDLISIITRFRMHTYVLIADIAKMYRQVMVNPQQTPLQRILWRENEAEEIRAYELITLTYGTTPASYLATRCLVELANINSNNYSLGAEVIRRDFYMDDMLTGADSAEEAKQIMQQVDIILKQGCFELRKWASNDSTLLDHLKDREMPHTILDLDKNSTIKTLGIQWIPTKDIFQYSTTPLICNKPSTKREILSRIAQVFDPLGLISPVIIRAKILIQELWKTKIGWDESIPIHLHTAWINYQHDLAYNISNIKVGRRVIEDKNVETIELHGFCDASEKAYVRSGSTNTGFKVNLLCAKSRVAPLKAVTLPRLELCAANLLAKLTKNTLNALQFPSTRIFYWSDSTIVLHWIKQQSRSYKTFVANRISFIQETTNYTNWHHISTKENPADIISRGIEVAALSTNKLWWHGPAFLSEHSIRFYIDPDTQGGQDLELKAEKSQTFVVSIITDDLLVKFSKLTKLFNVTAYCQRFIQNCKSPKNKQTDLLTCEEIWNAEKVLLRSAQRNAFCEELIHLKTHKFVQNNSNIKTLCPFIDDNGLLRVGGRLERSTHLSYNVKHPILLPAKHNLSQLIISHTHEKQLHAGHQGTLAAVRERYWIISGKNEVKRAIKKCITCQRFRPKATQYIMGQLPTSRIEPSRPFTNTGVDYAGPFLIKEGQRRSKRVVKVYAAVFVCFATKAIHIELANDLTSEAFIAILKRFIARRGMPANLYSDNATNFVSANRELKELGAMFEESADKIQGFLRVKSIKWNFIPVRSPHFGGLWEAAIKSIKHHLKRVTKNTSLTFVELYTLLTQIESILNSRPLVPLSEDPNDYSFLTPGHFLIGDSLTAVPEPTLEQLQQSRLSRWQYVENMKQHIWKRWSQEYLSHLQQRTKWTKAADNIQPGQLVMLKDDNAPSQLWITGRISEVHPGIDGIVRAATVRLPNGTYTKRAASRFAILPVEEAFQVESTNSK